MLAEPRHPYTRALLDALPHPEAVRDEPLVAIAGSPPSPGAIPPGCAFNPRCGFVQERCRSEQPELVPRRGRVLACPPDPLQR